MAMEIISRNIYYGKSEALLEAPEAVSIYKLRVRQLGFISAYMSVRCRSETHASP
jgi:hypothetical protein